MRLTRGDSLPAEGGAHQCMLRKKVGGHSPPYRLLFGQVRVTRITSFLAVPGGSSCAKSARNIFERSHMWTDRTFLSS